VVKIGITGVMLVLQEWDNDYLTWKPEDYDGVKELVVLPTKVWLPDIGIENR